MLYFVCICPEKYNQSLGYSVWSGRERETFLAPTIEHHYPLKDFGWAFELGKTIKGVTLITFHNVLDNEYKCMF